MGPRIPPALRAAFGQKFLATPFLFATAALLAGMFLRGWDAVEVVSAGVVIGMLGDLWRDSLKLERSLDMAVVDAARVEQEREAALVERDRSREELEALARVEAENAQLRYERDQLSQRLHAPPRALLEDVLQGLGSQLEILALVKKHRALKSSGDWQWPVTSIRLTDDINVAVLAHADEPTRVAGEYVSLMNAGGYILASLPVTALESQLSLVIAFDALPEDLQDRLLEDGSLLPGGYVLRLTGASIPPYYQLTDVEIDDLVAKLRAAASAASHAVVGDSATSESTGQEEA